MVPGLVAAAGALVLVFLLGVTALVRSARGVVASSWGELQAAIDARAAAAREVGHVVGAYAGDGPEVSALSDAAGACQQASVDQREAAQQELLKRLRRVLALVTEYPELAGGATFREVRTALDRAQAAVVEASAAYEAAAARLNRRLERRILRPGSALLRCAPAPSFEAGGPIPAG